MLHLRRIGDDENVFERHDRQTSIHGLLKKRAVAEQFDQLLGRLLATYRPEALAAPAGHDDDESVGVVRFSFHAFLSHRVYTVKTDQYLTGKM